MSGEVCWMSIAYLKRAISSQTPYGNGISTVTELNDAQYLDSSSSFLEMSFCSESVLGTSERDLLDASLDTLPMRKLQSFPLFLNASNRVQNQLVKPKSWRVQPGYLILTIPSVEGSAERVHMTNHFTRFLSFELCWPAHILTVMPQHGVLDPESEHHIDLPVQFKPELEGRFEELLVIQTDICGRLAVPLIGEAFKRKLRNIELF